MNWKRTLPKGIDITALSLEDCRNFKHFHERMASLSTEVSGPPGFCIFYPLMHHLLLYAMCCLQENTFPALNKCWDALSPFTTDSYDCEWLVYCWIFCDFPLVEKKSEVLLDHFEAFMLGGPLEPSDISEHLRPFCSIMKASRLGLYQEVLSSSKITKYKELFTNRSITASRGCSDYDPGEIFLTRIVTYLGDTFSVHAAKSYPGTVKRQVEGMIRNKMHYISSTTNESADYERFMTLAGPYWMSCTDPNESTMILFPDEYTFYY